MPPSLFLLAISLFCDTTSAMNQGKIAAASAAAHICNKERVVSLAKKVKKAIWYFSTDEKGIFRPVFIYQKMPVEKPVSKLGLHS